MNRPLPSQVNLPKPPDYPETLPASPGLRSWLGDLTKFARELARVIGDDLRLIHAQINNAVQGLGLDLESDTTLSPTHAIHRVTGTARINTITAPEGFSGPVFLIATDAWGFDQYTVDGNGVQTGNIAIDLTAVSGQCVVAVYNPKTELWHPVNPA